MRTVSESAFSRMNSCDNLCLGLTTQVHAWRFSLIQRQDVIARLFETLSADEIARIERLHFPEHREKAVVARGVLRTILGEYLDMPASKLNFFYGEAGKPALNFQTQTKLEFNLTHSHQEGVLAITCGRTLGVDIEYLNAQSEFGELANRFFSLAEVRLLEEIDPARRNLAFYHIWVQKEAYLKALGQGLSIPLNSFSVSVDPDLSARLIKASDHIEGAQADWLIHRINVPKNYVGAIAVDGDGLELVYFDWCAREHLAIKGSLKKFFNLSSDR